MIVLHLALVFGGCATAARAGLLGKAFSTISARYGRIIFGKWVSAIWRCQEHAAHGEAFYGRAPPMTRRLAAERRRRSRAALSPQCLCWRTAAGRSGSQLMSVACRGACAAAGPDFAGGQVSSRSGRACGRGGDVMTESPMTKDRPFGVSRSRLREVPTTGRRIRSARRRGERAAFARARLPEVAAAGRRCSTSAAMAADGLHVVGRGDGDVGQTCVVTLEPWRTSSRRAIDLLFEPRDGAQRSGSDGFEDAADEPDRWSTARRSRRHRGRVSDARDRSLSAQAGRDISRPTSEEGAAAARSRRLRR